MIKIGNGLIYNGDCLEVMKKLPDKSVDLILCDLPYGTTSCSWDVVIPFESLWKQYKRLIKPKAAIVLFGQEPFSSFLRISNLEMFKYDWYWEKERLTNIHQVKKRAGKVIETVSVFYDKQCTYNPQMQTYHGERRTNKVKNGVIGGLSDSNKNKVREYKDNGTRYPTQLLKFKRDILTSNLHPTQKPVALMEYLIRTYSDEDSLVLDNCSGSGTVGVACENTSRKYILIEKDEHYFNIGHQRLLEHVKGETIETNSMFRL